MIVVRVVKVMVVVGCGMETAVRVAADICVDPESVAGGKKRL
jgi:hypothetical protein